MVPNHSPWIAQLKRTRPVRPIDEDITTDVVIVGGGIAGVSTAFFALRDTSKKVVLLEGDKVAHGATGHNAGQIASYFEKPFSELVSEFGLDMAADGQRSVESAWSLIDEILRNTGLATPVYRFTGYAGCSTLDQVLLHLKNNRLRLEGGLQAEAIHVAKEWEYLDQIPKEYEDLYATIAKKDLLGLLNTTNPEYIASLSFQKGCMNSALFTEELVGYLLSAYPDRFKLYEGSKVESVVLGSSGVTVHAVGRQVAAEHGVLCTNGFENFHIRNEAGPDIDTTFHHMICGRIGYMAGYIQPMNRAPTAVSYFPKPSSVIDDPTGEPYFYLTRRPDEHETEGARNLVCAGGPDSVLPNLALYSREAECREDMRDLINDFLCSNYEHHPKDGVEYAFCWHGLMGYTPNGIRRIGPEPKNDRLLYNLGCNGVGILPSIYGGKRISQIFNTEPLGPSIFDPN